MSFFAALSLLATSSSAGSNDPGSLDRSFSNDGKAQASFGSDRRASPGDLLVRRGRLVTVGDADFDGINRFALSRHLSNGKLDESFGGDGTVTTAFPGEASPTVAARYGKWKTLVGGSVIVEGIEAAFARYRWDGSPDPNFGDQGKVAIDLDATSFEGYVFDVRVLGGGRFLAAVVTDTHDVLVARFLEDGSLDDTFGDEGVVRAERVLYDDAEEDEARGFFEFAIELLPSGKFIAAGDGELVAGRRPLVVARYNEDGTLDESFSEDGYVVSFDAIKPSTHFRFHSMAIDPEDNIVLAGTIHNDSVCPCRFRMVRLTPEGDFDSDFSADGITTAWAPEGEWAALDVVVQPDLKILVAGQSEFDEDDLGTRQFRIDRYESDGSRDKSFGGGDGIVRTSFAPSELGDAALSISLYPGKRFVVAGEIGVGNGESTWTIFGVARYNR